ncbi:hypothetical protein Rsub_09686 [Raphidocelis subcapitata]|uniref:Uncharacterized protein n=1 Tax=Raphidocelis subcapitata TaxID=307507 RepID=A0A2V0PFZ1_9CHLO|nr:hypothetical protein Rsub_09686 [Raphidocelis subcapitata]|eukprot:GBF96830.1 hypothetical protein Rsub_09686 [Raphidocelis subcapitata]
MSPLSSAPCRASRGPALPTARPARAAAVVAGRRGRAGLVTRASALASASSGPPPLPALQSVAPVAAAAAPAAEPAPRAAIIPAAAAAACACALELAPAGGGFDAAALLEMQPPQQPQQPPAPPALLAELERAAALACDGAPLHAAAAVDAAPPGGAGASLSAALDLIAAPYRAYSDALERHPLLTKALTSCVGFMLGDLVAQHVADSAAGLDAIRVLRLGAYGLLLDGPLGAAWYDWLEAHAGQQRDASTVVIKTTLDQIVYASAGTALFFTVNALLEGHGSQIPATLAAKFWPTLAANWVIWPAAHLVNFRFVPSPYRLAYNNTVAIGWLALLSAITHSTGAGTGGGGGGCAALVARAVGWLHGHHA